MLPTFAAAIAVVPVALLLRVAGMGLCAHDHHSDKVDRAPRRVNTGYLSRYTKPVIKRGKVQ
jgi:hypothetical protein